MDGILGYLNAVDYLPELAGKIALVKSDFNVPLTGDIQTLVQTHSGSFGAPFIKTDKCGRNPPLVTHPGA
jgi:hypothetical protein